MNDRVILGFGVGVVGGVVSSAWSYLSYFFHWTTLRYVDFAAVIIYGNQPQCIVDLVFAQLVQLVFSGLLGILFLFLLPVH
jgi:hypothetical protein